MKHSKKNILTWAPTVIAASIISIGAILKLAAFPPLVDIYTKIGLVELLKPLAIAEISFVMLFIFNRTMKIGFYLLTGYFGGAMAVEISHGNFFILPAAILSLVWFSAHLRDASIFRTMRAGWQLRTREINLHKKI